MADRTAAGVLSREDALAFYKRFYTPNNAILVVAGDVTAEEVKALVDETYAKVKVVTEIGPRVRPQEPVQEAPRTAGFGAEIAAILAEKAILDLHGPVLRVTGFDVPYPYWKIEDRYMPSVERVVGAARKLLQF